MTIKGIVSIQVGTIFFYESEGVIMFNGRLGTFRWRRSLRSPITGCGDVPPRGWVSTTM